MCAAETCKSGAMKLLCCVLTRLNDHSSQAWLVEGLWKRCKFISSRPGGGGFTREVTKSSHATIHLSVVSSSMQLTITGQSSLINSSDFWRSVCYDSHWITVVSTARKYVPWLHWSQACRSFTFRNQENSWNYGRCNVECLYIHLRVVAGKHCDHWRSRKTLRKTMFSITHHEC